MNKLLCALVIMAASAAPSIVHAACTELSLPATISSPGNYCLAADYTTADPAEKSIEIAASDVTVDCQGHRLTSNANSNSGTSVAIFANNRHDITVQNCRIMGGYSIGIDILQNNSGPNANYYVTLADNYIGGPYLYGIRAYGSAIEILRNHIYDIGGQLNSHAAGIRIGAGTGFAFHLLKENLIAGTNTPYTNAFGILSDKSVAGIFIGNGVTGSSASNTAYKGYGIRILGGSGNRITDNHVNGSGRSNDVGITTNDTGSSCFDNYIRAATKTTTCNASLGNY